MTPRTHSWLLLIGSVALVASAFLGSRMASAAPPLGPSLAAPAQVTTTPVTAGEVEQATLDEAVALVSTLNRVDRAAVLSQVETQRATDVVGRLDIAEAAETWGLMEPKKAGQVFDGIPAESRTRIVEILPEQPLIERLPEVTPARLWDVPVQVLAAELPSVPIMHLDFWVRPEPPAGLAPATGVDLSEDITAYTLPVSRTGEWAQLVGSPAPFETIWAKFSRTLPNVRVTVESLTALPANTPSFAANKIVNSVFRIDINGMEPDDIRTAAAIVSVRTSWIEANDVHKWSIQFNRFDETAGAWVPSPSKRIREDQERVFFAVVVPGFSPLAITGSTELDPQVFEVTNLGINPSTPTDGIGFTVSAMVTNKSAEHAAYPADLWIDNEVLASQMVPLDPGQTLPFSFDMTKPVGEYKVRVERLVETFTVQARVASPVTGDVRMPMALLAALGAALLLTGLTLTGANTIASTPRRD